MTETGGGGGVWHDSPSELFLQRTAASAFMADSKTAPRRNPRCWSGFQTEGGVGGLGGLLAWHVATIGTMTIGNVSNKTASVLSN